MAVAVAVCLSGSPVPAQEGNLALGRPVSASGPTAPGQPPGNLTDGDRLTYSHPLDGLGTSWFFYQIDLGKEYALGRIVIWNRTGCCPERQSNYLVMVASDNAGKPGKVMWLGYVRKDGSNSGDGGMDTLVADMDPNGVFLGRYILIANQNGRPDNPQIAEVEVYQTLRPVIRSFHTDDGNITRVGHPSLPASATLSWEADFYDTLTLDQGIGQVPGPRSSLCVSPSVTTTYTLCAANAAGQTTASVTVGVDEPVLDPVVTEFMADNASTIEDEDGEHTDWIEIHNPNAFTLNIGGYYLTDDPGNRRKWQFPSTSVPADGYLVIFASGKDRTDPDGELHTSFQLSRDGDYLGLVARDGVTMLQQFPPERQTTNDYPKQKEDVSYGLDTNGAVGFFLEPTPGKANGPRIDGFVEDTKVLPDRGFYDAPIGVNIATATKGAVIRYTTDGSEPKETHGAVFSGPIPVMTTTVLRSAAFKSGLVPTNVDTHTYIFLDNVIASSVMNKAITQDRTYAPQMRAALTDLPTMSIATPAGVIDQSTKDVAYPEVRASVEWIMPDASKGFQENAGVAHYGGRWPSVNFAKKSFRLYFRREYGAAKLRFPVFTGYDHGIRPVEVFDQLELHSGSHDMSQRGFYMSGHLTDDTMLDIGNLNPHGRFVHMYLNGVYWGLFHLRERWNADMNAQYLGG